MNLYKIVIKPVNSFCSPLQSDTFFGAFCWNYLYRYGQQALQELLDRTRKGEPDIIFSNAFPAGRLPVPLGINGFWEKTELLHTKQERVLSRRFDISLAEFNRAINGKLELFAKDREEGQEMTAVSWRNMVNRKTGLVDNLDGAGGLFEAEETYSTRAYDVYMYSTLEKNVLKDTVRDMFRFGIGARRSAGKGIFHIESGPEEFNGFQVPKRPNGFVALSNFIPQRKDPTEGWYRIFVKYPKVSGISSEEDSPFKKPLIFLEAGSVFYDQPVRAFYGSCVEKVALKAGSVSEEIVTGAYTVAVPCHVVC